MVQLATSSAMLGSTRMLFSKSCIRSTNYNCLRLHLSRAYSKPAPTNIRAARNGTPVHGSKGPVRAKQQIVDGTQQSRDMIVKQLYAEGHTTLYVAPRRITFFRFQCWTVAAIGMSFITLYTMERRYDIEDMKNRPGMKMPWLTLFGEFATASLTALGVGVALYRTTNIVQTVRLVKEMDKIFLRISWRHVLPFVKSHVAVLPQNLGISQRLSPLKSPPSFLNLKKLNESSVSALIVSVMGNTMRGIPLILWHIWHEGGRFFTNEGIVNARILGEAAKMRSSTAGYLHLDVDGDWTLCKNIKDKDVIALLHICPEDKF